MDRIPVYSSASDFLFNSFLKGRVTEKKGEAVRDLAFAGSLPPK